MDHSLPLISTLAIAFGLAIGFGYIAERCRFPALVGYLVAGIMAGKHTWGSGRHAPDVRSGAALFRHRPFAR